jgi:hypothetical protein
MFVPYLIKPEMIVTVTVVDKIPPKWIREGK